MDTPETSHPGQLVRMRCIEPAGLTVTEAAGVLGVTRQTLNNVLNGKTGISPEMALRLEKAFGETSEAWLGLQMRYDLAEARKREHEISARRWNGASSADQPRLL